MSLPAYSIRPAATDGEIKAGKKRRQEEVSETVNRTQERDCL
jgi:hypothetical protein